MRLFAIADPHLSRVDPKPMDIFGPGWDGHPEAFFDGWRSVVGDDDVVLVPGDLSWAMRLDDALVDLRDIADLPGRKVILRGNHDYWWPSISKLRKVLPDGMVAIQNDAVVVDEVVIAGTRGWRCLGRCADVGASVGAGVGAGQGADVGAGLVSPRGRGPRSPGPVARSR